MTACLYRLILFLFFLWSVWLVFVCMCTWRGWFHCEQVNVFVRLCERMLGCAYCCVFSVSHHPVQRGAAAPRCCFHHLPQPLGLKPVKICMHLF